VGLVPLVLKLESAKVLPPIEGLDVQITIDRGAKELRTAANSPVSGGQERPQFAPLASVSAIIANRLLDQELGINDQLACMSFSYRWTVDAATRGAAGLNWSNVQISMGVIYELTDARPRQKGR